ncbi:hypothetical protein D3C71_1462400 [compost metagenome]
MYAAAALSEGGGDRAQSFVARAAARAHHRCCAGHGARRGLRGPGHVRVSGGPGLERPAVCVHRMQPTPAGGAHHHRRGHRRGPGAGADRTGRRPHAAGHRPRPRRTARRVGLCRAVAHQCRNAGRTGQRHPRQRHAQPLRPAHRPWCARGHARCSGRHAVAALRHAAGQAHRAHAQPAFCGCAAPLAARAGRVPHRRRGHQPRAAAGPCRTARDGEPAGAHALAGIRVA